MDISLHLNLKESCFMVTECIHHCMYISRKSCYKITECIYHRVYSSRKVFIKSRNGYITACTSQEKLLYSYRMYISLRVHLKESCYKVTACICHCVDISRNAVTKLGSVNITARTSQEKSL